MPRHGSRSAGEVLAATLDATTDALHVIVDSTGAGAIDTELPAARLAADNLALPTAPDVLATLMGYDGTTLDMVRVTPTGGGLVIAGMVNENAGQDAYTRTPAPLLDSAGNFRTIAAVPFFWNGATYDRPRNNNDGTALASAARTATTNSADLTNYNSKAVHVVIDVTVWTADALTPKIQGKDVLSGKYYDILVGAAISATGTTVLKVGPGIAAAANAAAADMLPRTWRVVVTHAGATTTTYSVGYSLNMG